MRVKVIGRLYPYTLVERDMALPCCKRFKDGWCGKLTRYAITVEHESYTTVYPYCAEHLPEWAVVLLKRSSAGR